MVVKAKGRLYNRSRYCIGECIALRSLQVQKEIDVLVWRGQRDY